MSAQYMNTQVFAYLQRFMSRDTWYTWHPIDMNLFYIFIKASWYYQSWVTKQDLIAIMTQLYGGLTKPSINATDAATHIDRLATIYSDINDFQSNLSAMGSGNVPQVTF